MKTDERAWEDFLHSHNGSITTDLCHACTFRGVTDKRGAIDMTKCHSDCPNTCFQWGKRIRDKELFLAGRASVLAEMRAKRACISRDFTKNKNQNAEFLKSVRPFRAKPKKQQKSDRKGDKQ